MKSLFYLTNLLLIINIFDYQKPVCIEIDCQLSYDSVSAKLEILDGKILKISVINRSTKGLYFRDIRPLFTNLYFKDSLGLDVDRTWLFNNVFHRYTSKDTTISIVSAADQKSINTVIDTYIKQHKTDNMVKSNILNYRKLASVRFLFLEPGETYSESIKLGELLDNIGGISFQYVPIAPGLARFVDSVGLKFPAVLNENHQFSRKLSSTLRIQ